MIDKKVIMVMLEYNAEKTLIRTYEEIPKEVVDAIILIDDVSRDNTVKVVKKFS